MPPSPYALAPSVHWVTVHGFSIILDVAGDKYLSVPARQFELLLHHLEGEAASVGVRHEEMPPDVTALFSDLVARRILLPGPARRLAGTDQRVPAPERLISAARSRAPAGRALLCAAIFLKACLVAEYCFRFKRFSRIISRVATHERRGSSASLETLVELTQLFHALRPFYPRSYLCLFDSLALLEFLAHWHYFPSLVFGVTVDPFEAHCWVQHGSIVLCDTWRFQARWCSQIMVV